MSTLYIWITILVISAIVSVTIAVIVIPILNDANKRKDRWAPNVVSPVTVSPPLQENAYSVVDTSVTLDYRVNVSVPYSFQQRLPIIPPPGYPNLVEVALSPNATRLAVMSANSLNEFEPIANGGRNVRVDVFAKAADSYAFEYAFPLSSVSLDVVYPTYGQILFLTDDRIAFLHRTHTTTYIYIQNVLELRDQVLTTIDTSRDPTLRHTGTLTPDKVAVQVFDSPDYKYYWLHLDGTLDTVPFHSGPYLHSLCSNIGVTLGNWNEDMVRVYRAYPGQVTWARDTSFDSPALGIRWGYSQMLVDGLFRYATLLNNGKMIAFIHPDEYGGLIFLIHVDLETFTYSDPVDMVFYSDYPPHMLTNADSLHSQEGGSLVVTGNQYYKNEYGQYTTPYNPQSVFFAKNTWIYYVTTYPPETSGDLYITHNSHIRLTGSGTVEAILRRFDNGNRVQGSSAYVHQVIPII